MTQSSKSHNMHVALLGDKIENACLVHRHTDTPTALAHHQCGLHSSNANAKPPPPLFGYRVGKHQSLNVTANLNFMPGRLYMFQLRLKLKSH